MALIDMEGRCLQVNNALCRITGHEESELKAKSLRSFTHPGDIDLDLPLLQQLLNGEISSYQIEKRYRHAWGHYFWVLLTKSIVRDAQGRPLYIVREALGFNGDAERSA